LIALIFLEFTIVYHRRSWHDEPVNLTGDRW
jgi:hypothetical protein